MEIKVRRTGYEGRGIDDWTITLPPAIATILEHVAALLTEAMKDRGKG